ncbi:MAG: hypothetical protein LJE84_09505 [Gammaproteobacteria bacterium]|nr:hypothetical protein [Gammaproteobacteria bacterium]
MPLARSADTTSGSGRLLWIAGFAVILVSAVLMALAARGDLWMDEIWSLTLVRDSRAWTDAFFEHHRPNNHRLNTFYLYLLGQQSSWYTYRLLAIVSGIGSLLTLGWIARRRGKLEALLVVCLAGFSFPLIHYFSEARGYAPAIFFSLLGYAFLESGWQQYRTWKAVAFAVCIALALEAQLNAVFVYGALLLYSIWRNGNYRNIYALANELVRFHGAPVLICLVVYAGQVRTLITGTGPVYDVGGVLMQTFSVAAGFPGEGNLVTTLAVLAAMLAGIGWLYRRGQQVWMLFLLVLLVVPAVLLLIKQPAFLYLRFFIICFPFLYLLASYVLADLLRAGGARRAAVIGLVLLSTAGQLYQTAGLIRDGRGHYSDAIRWMIEHSPPGVITVGSENEFQVVMMFAFYARYLPVEGRFTYIKNTGWKDRPPRYLISRVAYDGARGGLNFEPETVVQPAGLPPYDLVRVFPHAGFSGWHWYLYQRRDSKG